MGDQPDNTAYPAIDRPYPGTPGVVQEWRPVSLPEWVDDLGEVDGIRTFRIHISRWGVVNDVPPPNSPAGGGGRGYFTSRRPAGDSTVDDLHHFAGLVDNPDDDPDSYYAALDGVRCVLAARDLAIMYTPAVVYEKTGMALAAVLEGLLPGLAMCAVVVGFTTAVGAGVGALLGLLEGIVGALPGAVIGGELGFDAGMYLLSWLGVGFLIAGIGESLGEAVKLMKEGAFLAWRGRCKSEELRQFFIESGARRMAEGLAVVIRALLEGVVLYITGRGGVAATERLAANVERLADGARRAEMAAERLRLQKLLVDDLLERLRQNNLLRPFADWVKNHVDDLVNNPKLRGKIEPPPPALEEVAGAPQPSSAPQQKQGPKPESEGAGKAAPSTKGQPAQFGKAATNDYKQTFFEAHPETRGKVVVHHAVEQQVKTKYPGLVSDAEMHSLGNLRGIPKGINSDLHLSKIRKSWNQFYRNNPNPTKQQLLDHATKIDDQFGHLFDPPVR